MGARGEVFALQSSANDGQQLLAESRPQVSTISILICSEVLAIIASAGLLRLFFGAADLFISVQFLAASVSYLMGLALMGVIPGRGMWGPERIHRRFVLLTITFLAPAIVSLFLPLPFLLTDFSQCALVGSLLFFLSCFFEMLAIMIADSLGVWRCPAVFVGDAEWERRIRYDLKIYPELGLELLQTNSGHADLGVGLLGNEFSLRHMEPMVFDPNSPPHMYNPLQRLMAQKRQGHSLIFARAVKRGLDIFGALFGLAFFLPVLIVTGLSIFLIDGTPIFYTQKRGGRGDKVIHVLKFRSMYRDAESCLNSLLVTNPQAAAEWNRHFKLRNDPRVLPKIGSFIRKSSIDELPQLWNVLKGDMSLVGPRPFPYLHLAVFSDAFRDLRASVPPGLSGLWQVTLRSNGATKDQEILDRAYVERWSIWLDLYILFRTPIALFMGKGAR